MELILILVLKGVALGFAIAAPIGPIGSLCIQRTMERGFWQGLSTGLGAAIGDAMFAVAAAAGFQAFEAFLVKISLPLKLFGGLIILVIGIRVLLSKPAFNPAKIDARDFLRTMAGTFFLTITNPATLLGFTALFAGAGIADSGGVSPYFLVLGVFLGSLLWWTMLSGTVFWLMNRLSERFALWVSRASAFMLIGFGVVSLGLAARQVWV